MNSGTVLDHNVVSRSQWQHAARELLDQEKELTRQSDDLARRRRELPWTLVEKEYAFAGPCGRLTLGDLFGDRSQLAIYHFMFAPDWSEGCPGCSYVTDHTDGALNHLAARDVSFVLVSRAALEKLQAFKQRMGWQLPWVSSGNSDFNQDFGVTFTAAELASGAKAYNFATTPPHGEENPGLSFFFKDAGGAIYHTYSTFGRGLEAFLGTYAILDRAPKGRDEDALPAPMAWLRHHDKYESSAPSAETCCQKKNG